MSAAWIIYFAGIVNGLLFVLFAGGIISAIAAVLFPAIHNDIKATGEKTLFWPSYWLVGFSFFCIVSWVLIPGQKTIYLMAGAKVTEDIVKSPEAKQIGDKILKVINTKLDEQIEEKRK